MKVSILMPAYNDGQYISLAIESVLAQTYNNWELLIMDDGSTDHTASVVNQYSDERIHFFQQSNQGQLRALDSLSSKVKGDIVMMLHSDDLLYESTSLEKNLKYFENTTIDGVYCPMIRFFPSGKPDLISPVQKKAGPGSSAKLLILLGSNIIPDPFFIRTEKFFSHVKTNYLEWNIQYWLDFKKEKVSVLKLQYSVYPWYYYRIYESNYSNSIIGNFETFFGRLRSVFFLSDYSTVPFPGIQKELMRRFGLGFALPFPASKKHLARIITIFLKLMKQRLPEAYTWFFDQLLCFYENTSNRTIMLDEKIDAVYSGADSRKFYNDLINETLPSVYNEIILKLKDGFSTIQVINDDEKSALQKILKFLCIRATIIVQ